MKLITKPWGEYFVQLTSQSSIPSIDLNYLVKTIIIEPGKSLSMQSHAHREELWVVTSGCIKYTVDNGDTWNFGAPGSVIHVPINATHRIKNMDFLGYAIILEVQIGKILDENDIVRYEDDYGRGIGENNV